MSHTSLQLSTAADTLAVQLDPALRHTILVVAPTLPCLHQCTPHHKSHPLSIAELLLIATDDKSVRLSLMKQGAWALKARQLLPCCFIIQHDLQALATEC